jgi:FkbM family methyltransferase
MSWRTNKVVVGARNVGRSLGLNRAVALLTQGKGYEERYDASFSQLLREGDCIWDVGSNIGYYTMQFAAKVGSGGAVYAFEPSPVNFSRLTAACAGSPAVKPHQIGLGKSEGVLPFAQGADTIGATSRIVANADDTTVSVQVRPGAALIAEGLARSPNIIKIDVEGYEPEVLEGLGEALHNPSLRAIGVEVHFGLLRNRGLDDAPAAIEKRLKGAGFTARWTDASHMIAQRL